MEEPLPSCADLARDYNDVVDRRGRVTEDHRRTFHTMILQAMAADVAARVWPGVRLLTTNTNTVRAFDNVTAAGVIMASDSAMMESNGGGTNTECANNFDNN